MTNSFLVSSSSSPVCSNPALNCSFEMRSVKLKAAPDFFILYFSNQSWKKEKKLKFLYIIKLNCWIYFQTHTHLVFFFFFDEGNTRWPDLYLIKYYIFIYSLFLGLRVNLRWGLNFAVFPLTPKEWSRLWCKLSRTVEYNKIFSIRDLKQWDNKTKSFDLNK